jgi:hypothetical protein
MAEALVALSNTMFGEKEAYRILVTEGCHVWFAPFVAVLDRYLAMAVEWKNFQKTSYYRYIAAGGDKDINVIWSSITENDQGNRRTITKGNRRTRSMMISCAMRKAKVFMPFLMTVNAYCHEKAVYDLFTSMIEATVLTEYNTDMSTNHSFDF